MKDLGASHLFVVLRQSSGQLTFSITMEFLSTVNCVNQIHTSMWPVTHVSKVCQHHAASITFAVFLWRICSRTQNWPRMSAHRCTSSQVTEGNKGTSDGGVVALLIIFKADFTSRARRSTRKVDDHLRVLQGITTVTGSALGLHCFWKSYSFFNQNLWARIVFTSFKTSLHVRSRDAWLEIT